MDKKFQEDSNLIDLINSSYHHHKRVVYESENGVSGYDYMKVRASRRIVNHIDNVVNDMTGKIRLIIDCEVIGNKKGTKWYTEYFSTPSYYRARKLAYRTFLENIEK